MPERSWHLPRRAATYRRERGPWLTESGTVPRDGVTSPARLRGRAWSPQLDLVSSSSSSGACSSMHDWGPYESGRTGEIRGSRTREPRGHRVRALRLRLELARRHVAHAARLPRASPRGTGTIAGRSTMDGCLSRPPRSGRNRGSASVQHHSEAVNGGSAFSSDSADGGRRSPTGGPVPGLRAPTR